MIERYTSKFFAQDEDIKKLIPAKEAGILNGYVYSFGIPLKSGGIRP
jgi:hypothetical protein